MLAPKQPQMDYDGLTVSISILYLRSDTFMMDVTLPKLHDSRMGTETRSSSGFGLQMCAHTHPHELSLARKARHFGVI